MKAKEELNALKEEFEALNKKLAELSEEELIAVAGGGGAPKLAKHTVVIGDTLENIAAMYHSNVAAILTVNMLSSAADIYPGMNLYVPILW